MKKQWKPTKEEIGTLCLALANLYHAGIGAGDALALLAEDEPEEGLKGLLTAMSRRADDGASLAQVLRETRCFPGYVGGLIDVGEQVGKTEEALLALGRYYEARARIDRSQKEAMLYPAVLLVVLLAVVVVLLVWVLPVFNDVYAQLGSGLSGVAGGLLTLGRSLRTILPGLCVLLGLIAVLLAVLTASPALRENLLGRWHKARSDRGILRQINTARFAQALSMGLNSGLTARAAVELASGLSENAGAFHDRCSDCLTRIDGGASLACALRESGLLSGAETRLLDTGLRGGSGETVMEQIALHRMEQSEAALAARTGKIEPALVVIMTVAVGAILLSVMLPLMQIMTTIG